MKTLRLILALNLSAVAVGLMAGPMVAQAQYDYLSIDYPGGGDTQVFGVNRRGHVVGNGIIDSETFPFVYASKKGTFTDVAPLAGYSSTSVLGTNDRGDMVGSVVSLDGLTTSAFIRDNDGNITVFDHPDAVSFTQARAVNNDGLVTGFRNDISVLGAGFIYEPETGTFTDLIPTSVFTIAQGITSKGDIVGSAVFLPDDDPCGTQPPGLADSVRYGWVRTTDGNVTYFDVNGLRTSARGITNSGVIAGFVQYPFTNMGRGFVTELDGTQCQAITIAEEDLLEFPGAFFTIAHGVTQSGDVVGWYERELGIIGGFIATPQ